MNGYQRINAAFKGVKADKTPIMLHNFMVAVKEAGITMDTFRTQPKIMAEVFIQAVDKYGYDGILIDMDTVTLAGACGVPVDFPEQEPARSHLGCLADYAGLDSLALPDLSAYQYAANWLEAATLLKAHFGDEIYIRGNCDQSPFSLASMIRGTQNWMMDFYTEEEGKIFQLLDYCTEVTNQFIQLMADTGVHCVSNGDSPAGPEMIPPEMYRKYALPYQKKVVAAAHEKKMTYVLHICGNTESIIDDMISSGADGLELDYKTDVAMANKQMAGKSTFLGNIDPSGVIALGTKELVAEETRKLLTEFHDNPRFILNAGCALPPSTPEVNLRTLIDTARNFVI